MTILTATRSDGFTTSPTRSEDFAGAIALAASRAFALAAIVAIHVAVVLSLTGALSGPRPSAAMVPAPAPYAAPAPVTFDVGPAAPRPGSAPTETR